MFLTRALIAALAVSAFSITGAQAQQTFSFDTTQSRFTAGSNNQGTYNNDGGTFAHDEFGVSDNYAVGTISGAEYRDFFSFDVRTLNLTGQQITGATLSLPRFNTLNDQGIDTRTLTLYDVTAGASALKTTRGSGDGASAFGTYFGDLGSGNSYGAFAVPTASTAANPAVLTLNSAAFGDIASRVSSNAFFSVGGALSTLPGDFNDAIFANSVGGRVTLNVTLSPVPAPPGVVSALLGFGITGWSARRRLRRSR